MSFSKGILTVLPVVAGSFDELTLENIFTLKLETMDGLLSFENRQLKLDNDETIEQVAREIEKFRRLTVLDLRGNTLGVTAGERLGKALKRHPELERCLWSDMFTGRLKTEIPPILRSLCSAMIQANCHITELDLSDNAFGPIGADGISEFLVSPAAYSLTTLRLNNNGLGSGGIRVAQCLIECHENAERDGKKFALKRFIAGRNRLEDPGAAALSKAFEKLQTLEEIRIPQNGIKREGISALALAFEKNPNLQIIDINDNTCTVMGAVDIAEVLPSLKNLVELDLGDCLCRDRGILAVISGLEGKRDKLKKVNFSGNELTVRSVDDLIEFFTTKAMAHVSVNFSYNNFGSEFEELVQSLGPDSNIDFGDNDDDQGSLSDESELDETENDAHYTDEEEEEYESGDANTSRETIINNSINQNNQNVDDMLNDMVTNGFGCMKLQKDDNGGVLSFLDQKLKLDTFENADEVAQKIENCAVVRVLELKGNTIGVEAGERLAKALAKHPELERCLWSDMFTGRLKTEIPSVLKCFGKAMIQAKCNIIELDLSDNAFGPIGAEGIKEFLESPSAFSLEVLKLNNNGLGVGGKQIAASLSQCLTASKNVGGEHRLRLKTFIAGRNRLENPGAFALSSTFKSLETLETIQIPQNGINKEGIKALADALKHNRNLRVLNLNDNTATQMGAYAIAENLKFLPHLEILDLGDCLCRDQGCHAIIDSLEPSIHRNLKEVNLSGSELSPQAAQLIINKWKKFNSARIKPVLTLGSNNFGELFNEIRNNLIPNVDIGESDDDCGSLSSDDEEYNSGDSDDDGDDEQDDVIIDDDIENKEPVNSAHGDVGKLAICENVIDDLKNEYESRVQDESAKVLLKLLIPVQSSGSNPVIFNKALTVAEEIVRRVATVNRKPISTTTQLINHFVAQSKVFGVKPEEDWSLKVDTALLGRFLRELLARGVFDRERALILHYFSPKE